MVTSLLLTIWFLILLGISLLLIYQKRFGKSYWSSTFSANDHVEEILFTQTLQTDIELDNTQKHQINTLTDHNFIIESVFLIPVIPDAKCFYLKNSEKKLWICCLFTSQGNFSILTCKLNQTILTITNLSSEAKLKTDKITRYNKADLDLTSMLALAEKIKGQKFLLSYFDYLLFFKTTFITDLFSIYKKDIEYSTVMAPNFYSTFERDNLYKAYAKKYNMHEAALTQKSPQILIINKDTYIDYLVTRLLVQLPNVSSNKIKIIQSARNAKELRTWFKSINGRLPEDKKFIFMGSVDYPIESDFYFCQRISMGNSN